MNRHDLQRNCVLAAQQHGMPGAAEGSLDVSLVRHISQKHFFVCTNQEMQEYLTHPAPENFPRLAWLMAEIDQFLGSHGSKISQCQVDKDPASPTHKERCVVVRHNLVPLPLDSGSRRDVHDDMDWQALIAAAQTAGVAPKRTPKNPAQPRVKRVKMDLDPATLEDHRSVVKRELANLGRVRDCLNSRWLEREQEVAIMLTSAVAGRHAFFRGPPGTGKTEMLQDFATMVGGTVFDTVLGMNTLRDEIEGPIDVPYLQSTGKQRRNRAGTITDCDFAVLDEVWKANSGLLNQMLRLMSQGDYFEEGRVHKAKTRCVFGASNEGPQGGMLEALHSRFMLRGEVGYVSNPDSRRMLLGFDEWDRPDIPKDLSGCLSLGDLDKIRKQALKIPTCPRFEAKWEQAIKELRECKVTRKRTGIVIDDRRAKALMEIARVWAFLQGDDAVTEPMVLILQYTAWDGLKEKPLVEQLVRRVLNDSDVNRAIGRGEAIKSQVAGVMGTGETDWKAGWSEQGWEHEVNSVAFGAPMRSGERQTVNIRSITCLDIQRNAWSEAAKV